MSGHTKNAFQLFKKKEKRHLTTSGVKQDKKWYSFCILAMRYHVQIKMCEFVTADVSELREHRGSSERSEFE